MKNPSLTPREDKGKTPCTAGDNISVTDEVDRYVNGESEEEEEDGEIESDDDWISQFAAGYVESDLTGPAVPDSLANLVSTMIKKRQTEEKEKKLLQDLLQPENIPLLTNPRVNRNVWDKMDSKTRSQDLSLVRVGDKAVKSIIASTQLAAGLAGLADLKGKVLGDTRRAIKDLTKTALTAVQAGASTLQEINQRRRDNIRTHLSDTFKSLCNVPDEEGEELFGADLPEKMKALRQQNDIGKQLTERPFLGRGRERPHPWKGSNRQWDSRRKQPQGNYPNYNQWGSQGRGRGSRTGKSQRRK